MKVSVIIPVYNVEKFLRESLDCIINQTLKDIEIICVDDGSEDNSVKILEEYASKDDRIKILKQKHNYAGTARNNGLKTAAGKYVIFLDADDIFAPEMLEKLYNRAEETNSDVTVCNSKYFINDIKTARENYGINFENLPQKEVFSSEDIAGKLFQTFVCWSWDKLYNRRFVLKHNLYFQSFPKSNDVYFVQTSLMCAEKISVINDCPVYYRHNENSITMNSRQFNFVLGETYRTLIAFMLKNKIYKEFEATFFNWITDYSQRVLDSCMEYSDLCMCYRKLKKEIFDDKYFDLFDDNKFYNKKNYRFHKRLKIFPNYFLYSLFNPQSIFSVRNRRIYKIITIAGIKIKKERSINAGGNCNYSGI